MPALSGIPKKMRKNFVIQRRVSTINSRGGVVIDYGEVNRFQGILADADPGERMRWQQMQHPISHTIAARGEPMAITSDRLFLDGRAFYVQGIDNPGGMGIWTIYYCEERPDANVDA